MFASCRAVSRLRNSTRQIKLGVDHIRLVNTGAPRIKFHGDRRVEKLQRLEEALDDPLRAEHLADPFRFQPRKRRRPGNVEGALEQPSKEPNYDVPLMSLRDMCTCPRCVDQSTR